MPCVCCAYNCSNRSNKTTDVSYFKFPLKDVELTKKWVINMKRDQWYPSIHNYLCSTHFEEKYMYKTIDRRRLMPNAIPTVFSFPPHLQKDTVPMPSHQSAMDHIKEEPNLKNVFTSTELVDEEEKSFHQPIKIEHQDMIDKIKEEIADSEESECQGSFNQMNDCDVEIEPYVFLSVKSEPQDVSSDFEDIEKMYEPKPHNEISNEEYYNTEGRTITQKTFIDFKCSCRRKCYEKFSPEERKDFFNKYWEMGSYETQTSFLASQISEMPVKRRTKEKKIQNVKSKSRRIYSRVFKFRNEQVCQPMFINTYQVSTKRVNTCLTKSRDMDVRDKRCCKSRDKHCCKSRGKNKKTDETD